MRSLFLSWVLAILVVASISPAAAQVLNPGFEAWSGGEPDSWYTTNIPSLGAGGVNVTPDTLSHRGEYAVRGEVTIVSDEFGPYDFQPGISNTAAEKLLGFPITGRPKVLRGWWMVHPAADFDAIGVGVTLWSLDTLIVATGALTRYAFSDDSTYVRFAMPINYQMEDDPAWINIAFGFEVGDVGSVFWLDDLSLSFTEVLSPADGDVVIAAEVDTIEWDPIDGNIDISYSVDSGSTFTNIVTNTPADSGRYFWDVPDTLLSTKAIVKIINSADPSEVVMSERFYVKPWRITRINDSGDYEYFRTYEDGWSAANTAANSWPESWWEQFDYVSGNDPNTGAVYPELTEFVDAYPSDFPDWPLFVDVFGVEQCYLGSSSPPTTYSTRAVSRWAAIKGEWGGSCYGYAVSSLLGFYHKAALLNRFPGIGSFTDLFGVSFSNDARLAVNHYHIHEYGDPFLAHLTQSWNTVDARQTLREAKEMFAVNNVDARPLTFYKNDGSAAHEVTPRLLRRNPLSPSRFTLFVYDSRDPGSLNQGFFIDSVANTWTDATGLGWGTGTTGCVLGLPSVQHFTTPTLPVTPGMPPRTIVRPMSAASSLEIYNTTGASITVRSPGGDSIGYSDSTLFSTIAGGAPVIPKTGSVHPPIGYSLPDGGYSVAMSDIPDTSAHLMFFTDSLVYAYRRSGIAPSETDLVSWNGGVGMKNPDAVPKTVSLEVVISADSSERIFTLSGLTIAQGDSVHVSEEGGSELVTGNPGGATSYDLEVRHATGAGTDRFFHAGIPIGAGVGHRIVPDWGDVEGGTMKILIDAGNDGSVDDSMFVSNELTGVEDRISAEIPARYALLQNYPNPFNPSTTISFDLPEVSEVSLKVYTLAGEEVAVLAEGMRQPGTYRVRFDGSGLPSGVYFYRLTAGTFSAGGKMVLLK